MNRLSMIVVLTLALPLNAARAGDNWPMWRGPNMDGVTDVENAPLKWSANENIRWKAKLPGPGNSSPVVWGNRVFVTCASEKGAKRSLLCFDRKAGAQQWVQSVNFGEEQRTHKTNPYCSSSPATDGERVVVWHGSAGLHCYDLQGEKLWSKDLGRFKHIWGTASSPVIHNDLVILSAGPGLHAFLAAYDKRNGDEVWRKELPDVKSTKIDEFRGSWSTPVPLTENGRTLMLLSLPLRLIAFRPETGDVVWSCEGLSKLAYTSPLVGDGVVVAMSGYRGPAIAVRTGGQGNVTATHRLWRQADRKKNPQRIGSGIIVDGHIYICNEPGIAWCMNAKTGEITWQKRLGSRSWSSMSLAAGRLYVSDTKGDTHVIEPDPKECRVLAKNSLGELIRASLAFTDGRIFARTYEHLYCIAED